VFIGDAGKGSRKCRVGDDLFHGAGQEKVCNRQPGAIRLSELTWATQLEDHKAHCPGIESVVLHVQHRCNFHQRTFSPIRSEHWFCDS
jgi:hypothetical protein